jgi:hypothetical protein
MYIGVYFSMAMDMARALAANGLDMLVRLLPRWLRKGKPVPLAEAAGEAGKKRTILGIAQEQEVQTVEPILSFLGGYTSDTFILLYTPIVIGILTIFRDETGMPELYEIRKQDMTFYLLFALIIVLFQLAADIFIHSSIELFHGWKIYDYMVYTRYRFLQRETRWKGLEDTLDECIEDSMRTLDQMCFSSQYYMMLALFVNGLFFCMVGLEMMLRSDYNMWSDPVFIVIILFVIFAAYMTEKFLLLLANMVRARGLPHAPPPLITLAPTFCVLHRPLHPCHA